MEKGTIDTRAKTEAAEREEAPEQQPMHARNKTQTDNEKTMGNAEDLKVEHKMVSRYGMKSTDAKSSLAEAHMMLGDAMTDEDTLMEAAYQIHQSYKSQGETPALSSRGDQTPTATPHRGVDAPAGTGNVEIEYQVGSVICV